MIEQVVKNQRAHVRGMIAAAKAEVSDPDKPGVASLIEAQVEALWEEQEQRAAECFKPLYERVKQLVETAKTEYLS